MVVLTVLTSGILLSCNCPLPPNAKALQPVHVGAWKVAMLVLRQVLTVLCGVALVVAAIISILLVFFSTVFTLVNPYD